jgi:Prokaryotic RING finger family 1
MARCSICYTVLREDEPITGCPECRQDYHKTCWDEIGGCGTYGCKQAAVAQKPPPPVLVGAGWGDTKPCPSCGQHINSSLLVCRCGARFPWADPMTTQDYQLWRADQDALAGYRKLLIFLFILSLIAITAPLAGLIAGVFAFVKRKRLAGANGTYLAMGYGSAALGVLYSILIAAAAMGA